ncbi:hypothetical protein DFJ63DRAFT_305946 [Scheffersomyces coipomensis]|uniref:uncharacterized protein n=1 Tax=Scheffersomyces coipomensis TaxID=1788519 RepID=UPI00315DED24
MELSLQFKTVTELNVIVTSTYKDLVKSAPSITKLLQYQVTLLELFTNQTRKLERTGYCDYEFAYICYSVALLLYGHIENDVSKEFQSSLKTSLIKRRGQFDNIKHFLQDASTSESGDEDPLMQRFQKLSSVPKVNSIPTIGGFDLYKYRDFISPKELHFLINSVTHGQSTLLIDFRESKDYNHNHINHSEIINIEPTLLKSIIGPDDKNLETLTDQDLEEKLKLHLPKEQYQKFQSRYKYDLIVLYNLNFGINFVDRISGIKSFILSDRTLNNPFSNLIEILMFKNKYISSHLRRYPIILAGGVYNWHAIYGDESLARTLQSQILTQSVARSPSPYLRKFGEYLSTAKSTSSTPVSNSFSPIQQANTVVVRAPLATTASNTAASPPPPPQQQQQPKLTRASSSTLTVTKAKESKEKEKSNMKFLEQYATGLVNLGNSCYMNCILQCLGATPQLTAFFFPNFNVSGVNSYRQHINVNNRLGTKGILTNNFVGLLADMFKSNGASFCPTNFKKVAGSLSPGQQFATFDQQDCIEFLNFILDGLHEDLNQMVISNPEEKKAVSELTLEQEKTRELLPIRLASTIEWERYLKLNFSIVVDYFQGQHLSQLRCLECGLTSTTYNSFSILSLPIPEKLGSTSNISLDDCLKEFVTTELLDENNKWHCPNCKKFTRSTKKISITRLPQVLIIHFKRFKVSPTGYFNKMDTFINYPVKETLDLTSYWPEAGTYINGTNKDSITKEKEEQILSTLPTRNQIPPFRYKLYGVANHYGNLTTGHYTSYVYKQSDNKKTRGWCYFDDSKVTYNCRESQVLNKNAYCLFYQRI